MGFFVLNMQPQHTQQSATLAIEKRVIQEVAKTMPFLPRCCHTASEEHTLMTCHVHFGFQVLSFTIVFSPQEEMC